MVSEESTPATRPFDNCHDLLNGQAGAEADLENVVGWLDVQQAYGPIIRIAVVVDHVPSREQTHKATRMRMVFCESAKDAHKFSVYQIPGSRR